MALLLTSTGLSNEIIKRQFLGLLNKPVSEIKVIFVPTASRTEHELKYVQASMNELLALGVQGKNIKTTDLGKKVSPASVQDYDVMYVCGGNTFYLLKKVRDSGFDRVIQEFVGGGKLYLGVSAGSILSCPAVDIASPADENDVNITDFRGLALVDFVVSPHYSKEEARFVQEYQKKSKLRVVPITDTQAVLVVDGKSRIIG
jgi:dipeptidase E